MNTPSKSRPLIFIIIFLLLTNIAVLAWLFWPKKTKVSDAGGQRNGMVMALKDSVGFSDAQVDQYKQLKEKQWKILKPMFDDIRKAKDSLYRLLGDESISDSVVNERAEIIGQKQKALDLQAFSHFKEVRTLCTGEQRPKYDSLIQKMIKKMGRPPRRNDSQKENKK